MKLTKLFKIDYDRIYHGKNELSVSNAVVPLRHEDAVTIPADSLAQAEMIADVILVDINATKQLFGFSRDALARGYQKTYVNENEYRFSHNELTKIECLGYCVIPDGIELIGKEFVSSSSIAEIELPINSNMEVKKDQHDEKT